MTKSETILHYIRGRLAMNAGHVANVLLGPKREDWFNSEAFIAINSQFDREKATGWVAYGEQEYRTILKQCYGYTSGSKDTPDVVGYRFSAGGTSIDFVIESKLVFSEETNVVTQIKTLASQLAVAKQHIPKATVIGIVYAAVLASDHKHAAKPETFFTKLSDIMDAELPKTKHKWVDPGRTRIVDGFINVMTSMPFPQCNVTLATGAKYCC